MSGEDERLIYLNNSYLTTFSLPAARQVVLTLTSNKHPLTQVVLTLPIYHPLTQVVLNGQSRSRADKSSTLSLTTPPWHECPSESLTTSYEDPEGKPLSRGGIQLR